MSEKYFVLEVGDLPEDFNASTKSKLELYFCNKRRSGGDDCEVKEHPSKRGTVLIYYKTEEAMKRVLKKTHQLEFKGYGTVQLQLQVHHLEDQSGETLPDTAVRNISFPNITSPKLEKEILMQSAQTLHQVSAVCDEKAMPKVESKKHMEAQVNTVLLKSDSPLPTEFLELYFESLSEHITIQEKAEENTWELTCLNDNDLKKILHKKDHRVNGVPVHIEMQETEENVIFDKRRFILEGFKESTCLSVIDLYIDSCSSNTEHFLEVLDDGEKVAVTFKADIDPRAFMKYCSWKKLDEASITVSRLESTDTVMVEGKLDEIPEDLLKLYFSNTKRSSGGDILSVTVNRSEGVAVIQFQDPTVIERVTARHHVISNIQLTVAPYFQSLQKPLYSDKCPCCEIPKVVEIPVEPAIKEYLQSNDLFKHQLEKVCSATYSDLDVSETVHQIMLKRNVDESKMLFYKVAKQWEQNAKEAVQSFLGCYDTEYISADTELWERIRRQCEALEQPDLGLWYNQSKNIITVVGEQQLVADTITSINHIIKEAEIALEIEKNTVEETVLFDTPKAAEFVVTVVQDSLCDVELQVNTECSPCQIKIIGIKNIVAQAKNCIEVAKNKMVIQNINLSSDMVKFITSLDLTTFASDYFITNGIKATLFSENCLTLIAAHRGEAEKAIHKIKETIKEESVCLSAEQAKVTESDKWKSFIEQLQGDIKAWNVKCNISSGNKKITVVGLTSSIVDIANKIKGYLDNKKTSSKVLDLKDFNVLDYVEKFLNPSLLPDLKEKEISILPRKMMSTPNVTINGASEYIDDALTAVKKYVESIVSESFVYSSPGEAKVLEKQKDIIQSKAVESGCMAWFTPQSTVSKPSSSLNFCICLNGLNLFAEKGDILKKKTDALVCPVDGDMSFNTKLINDVIRVGGSEIQEECVNMIKERKTMAAGDVLTPCKGKLQVKVLILAVTPIWGKCNYTMKGKALEGIYLKHVLLRCFDTAEQNQCTSIALPILGSNDFGFPVYESVHIFMEAVKEYCDKKEKSSQTLKEMYVMDTDRKAIKEFNEAAKLMCIGTKKRPKSSLLQKLICPDLHASGEAAVSTLTKPTLEMFGVTVTLKKGDITQEDTDAIVNCTTKTLDLATGVSGAILKAAGSSVRDECKALGSLQDEGVVLTGGGDLKCKFIAHMSYLPSAVGITKNAERILQECEKKNIKSIAFPAVGTGKGCMDPQVAIESMLKGFENHFQKTAQTVITSVSIIVFEQKIYDEFYDYFKERQQQSSTTVQGMGLQTPNPKGVRLSSFEQGAVLVVQSTSSPEEIKINNVAVTIRIGDITKELVQAIVNSTNKALNLKSGVSGAIFAQAGKAVEDECRAFGSLPDDGVVVTGGGLLSCDYIIHMVGPTTVAGAVSQTERVLQECEKKRITTVAFPAMGTGAGKMSAEDVIRAMLQGFSNHLSKQESSAIRFISIIIFESKLHGVFINGLKEWVDLQKPSLSSDSEDSDSDMEEDLSNDTNTKQSGSIEIKIGMIKVQTIFGDIIDEETNVIVNSNNNELNLNAGLSGDLLKAAGQAVEDECKAFGKQTSSGFVRTTAGKLKAKHIMHTFGLTSVDIIKSIMLKILNECQKLKLDSVSFPALGTGKQKHSPGEVAGAMMQAVDTFVKDCLNPSIRVIRFVILDRQILQHFHDFMEKSKTVSPKSKQNDHQGKINLVQSGCQSPWNLLQSIRYPSCRVEIYSTSKDAISRLHSYINDIIKDNCSKQLIHTAYGNSFSDVELQTICAMCEKEQIKVELQTDSIMVEGKTDDVLASVVKITSLLHDIKERIDRKQEEDILRKTVQWEIVTEETTKPLSSNLNYEFEMHFRKKQNIFKYIHEGQQCTVNFEKKEQTDSQGNCEKIRRRILLEDSQFALVQPPPTWTNMGAKDFDVVLLQDGSSEFKKVSDNFLKTCFHYITKYKMKITIVSIERIQNLKLWQSYSIRKQNIDRKYPSSQNETILYHGTTCEISQKINKHGFNRSFCGRNATHYGLGTYFAKEAYYSCDPQYSNPDPHGNKRIYQARVITGKVCQGIKDLKEPSPVDPLDPQSDLCDCAVDKLKRPFVYVIFCDDGAYPEYLITFKTVAM